MIDFTKVTADVQRTIAQAVERCYETNAERAGMSVETLMEMARADVWFGDMDENGQIPVTVELVKRDAEKPGDWVRIRRPDFVLKL